MFISLPQQQLWYIITFAFACQQLFNFFQVQFVVFKLSVHVYQPFSQPAQIYYQTIWQLSTAFSHFFAKLFTSPKNKLGIYPQAFPWHPTILSFMGVRKLLTSPLPIHCFFSGKFMMKSCFFGRFRVFSSVVFLYAQPIIFLRSYAPKASGKLPCNTEITDFYAGNVRSSGVISI